MIYAVIRNIIPRTLINLKLLPLEPLKLICYEFKPFITTSRHF